MEKNPASYKFEKRKKEIARQKKQEEKRQRQLEKKQDKQGITPLDSPLLPSEEIKSDSSQTDNIH